MAFTYNYWFPRERFLDPPPPINFVRAEYGTTHRLVNVILCTGLNDVIDGSTSDLIMIDIYDFSKAVVEYFKMIYRIKEDSYRSKIEALAPRSTKPSKVKMQYPQISILYLPSHPGSLDKLYIHSQTSFLIKKSSISFNFYF